MKLLKSEKDGKLRREEGEYVVGDGCMIQSLSWTVLPIVCLKSKNTVN